MAGKGTSMNITVGYYLSGAIALGIAVIGLRFLFAPHVAAAGYGVAVGPDARGDAYLLAKGIRDAAYGLVTAILIFNGSARLLGSFMLVAAIIPLADCMIVLKYGGVKAVAFGIHGVTALVMLIISGLLLLPST